MYDHRFEKLRAKDEDQDAGGEDSSDELLVKKQSGIHAHDEQEYGEGDPQASQRKKVLLSGAYWNVLILRRRSNAPWLLRLLRRRSNDKLSMMIHLVC